jgi:hypothetical protein
MSKSNKSRQDDSNDVEWLANGIGQATGAAKFWVIGFWTDMHHGKSPSESEWLSGFTRDRTMVGLLPVTQPDSEEH